MSILTLFIYLLLHLIRDSYVNNAVHAPAMASFELGMYYRSLKDVRNAKKWLKKSTSLYSGHFAEPMISFRVELALDSLNKMD